MAYWQRSHYRRHRRRGANASPCRAALATRPTPSSGTMDDGEYREATLLAEDAGCS